MVLGKEVYWVLKGKHKDGNVDELEIFDKRVSLSEIKDKLEEYREQGYTRIWLVKVENKEGKEREVKKEWVKNFPKPKTPDDPLNYMQHFNQMVMSLSSSIMQLANTMVQVSKSLMELRNLMGEGRGMTVEDVMAQIIYYEKLKETLASTIGTNQLDIYAILQLLLGILQPLLGSNKINELAKKLTGKETSLPQLPIQLPTQQQQEQQQISIPKNTPLVPMEVPKEVKEIIENVKKEVSKEIIPCPDGEVCLENVTQ